jgi:hypothetical protein
MDEQKSNSEATASPEVQSLPYPKLKYPKLKSKAE